MSSEYKEVNRTTQTPTIAVIEGVDVLLISRGRNKYMYCGDVVYLFDLTQHKSNSVPILVDRSSLTFHDETRLHDKRMFATK